MFAVIESGGKQHKVQIDEVVRLEKIECGVGETCEFPKVLMISDEEGVSIGKPFLDNGKVRGEIIDHRRGEKIRIIKFRRRKHYMKRIGHRQWFTDVKIKSIELHKKENSEDGS